MLNLIIFIPLLAALGILLGAPARKTALGAAIAHCALTVLAFLSYDRAAGGFQFLSSYPIAPEWKLNYLVGADGLSLLMLLLTGLVTLASIWLSPRVEKRENLFYACLLFITAGAAGAFASVDLFFFYAFHELALIPTFLLIGLWGSGERHTAAWKITIYLGMGSFILLAGLLDLYFSIPAALRTFDLRELQQLATAGNLIPGTSVASDGWLVNTWNAQARPYLLLLIGFGILISLFPFHSWAPSAYASAPTPAAMLHAGVLKKFGLYGLIRVALPLLPEGAKVWANLLLVLLVGNIIYIGFVTIAQRKLDLLLGYSSVMHMGYIFLGIAALNVVGVSGAALLMFAHGLSIAALFAMAGMLREKVPTLALESFGGLARPMPWLAFAFGLAAFASIGLPGFANFASEMTIFFGAFQPAADLSAPNFRLATIFALWGVVISAVYMLRAYRSIFMGEPAREPAGWIDPLKSRRWPITVLLAVLLLAGFAPQYFYSYLQPSIQALLPK
ncbi:MAG: Proton-translocating NADH-quinone oxidoreductase, chain [Chthoniobacter sp.]|nr:Proton-translocating NADH-quinone oxidoreductase, chain [Chthoniobacter sp.]